MTCSLLTNFSMPPSSYWTWYVICPLLPSVSLPFTAMHTPLNHERRPFQRAFTGSPSRGAFISAG
jgi:hypothetical protein